MSVSKEQYEAYTGILKEELMSGFGCTEPIAIAYAACKARDELGEFPDHIVVHANGNIIKNVKGVIVPGTGDLMGIETSAIFGVVAGKTEKKLECLIGSTPDQLKKVRELLAQPNFCAVDMIPDSPGLHIIVRCCKGDKWAEVELHHKHTNIVRITKDGVDTYKNAEDGAEGASHFNRKLLNVKDILEFAKTVDLEATELGALMKKQIEYNSAIAEEGLTGKWGVAAGKMLLEDFGTDAFTKGQAYAAAGSDARMSGCELPVVINSGSGNQGITVSMPVYIYAKENNIPEEKLLRALLASNLTAIHLKTGLGVLSAYCGAVSAGTGAAVGLCYLTDATMDQVEKTIINTLGNVSGIVCDGAKTSCATKIAASVHAGQMGYKLAMRNKVYLPDTGIIMKDLESTIAAVGRMGKVGMHSTDVEILKIMIGQ